MLRFKNFQKLILAVVCLSFGWAGFVRVSDAREWLGPEEKSGFKINEIYHSLPEIKSFGGGKLEGMPSCAANWKPSPPMVWVDFETRNYNVKPVTIQYIAEVLAPEETSRSNSKIPPSIYGRYEYTVTLGGLEYRPQTIRIPLSYDFPELFNQRSVRKLTVVITAKNSEIAEPIIMKAEAKNIPSVSNENASLSLNNLANSSSKESYRVGCSPPSNDSNTVIIFKNDSPRPIQPTLPSSKVNPVVRPKELRENKGMDASNQNKPNSINVIRANPIESNPTVKPILRPIKRN